MVRSDRVLELLHIDTAQDGSSKYYPLFSLGQQINYFLKKNAMTSVIPFMEQAST